MLVKGLPPDCALSREGKRWTSELELLAQVIERNDIWMRCLAIGQGREPNKVPPLPPIEHPHRVSVRERAVAGAQEIRSFIARLRR